MSATVENVENWSGKDRGDENFPVGAIVAPRLRAHVHAFYSFARNADDIADSDTPTSSDSGASATTASSGTLRLIARTHSTRAARSLFCPGPPTPRRIIWRE